jgi:predicted PurR-regulated permease PerM
MWWSRAANLSKTMRLTSQILMSKDDISDDAALEAPASKEAPNSASDQTATGLEHGSFLLLLAVVSLALAVIAWPFFTPILWAVLGAVMFQPLFQGLLARMRGHRNAAALLTLLIITFVILLPSMFVGGLVVEEAAGVVLAFQRGEIDIAAWFNQVYAALPANLRSTIESSGWADLSTVQARVQDIIGESAGLIARQAVAVGGGALGFFLSFGLGLYVTYFLLRDGRAIGQTVLDSLPIERTIADRLSEKFLGIVRATIKGSLVVGLVQGALGATTFWIVGIPSAILFGLVMTILSLLPAVGTALVWLPAAIWLLATGAIWEGIFVFVSGALIIGMADNVLRPILVGRDTGIPDWIILVTTLGGIAAGGLSGVVLGPLIAGLFLASWSILREQRSSAGPAEEALLSEEPATSDNTA